VELGIKRCTWTYTRSDTDSPPAREVILTVLQQLLFVEESMGDPETVFVRTEEDRSGLQGIKVWAPQLRQLQERDRMTLQVLLDLVDWLTSPHDLYPRHSVAANGMGDPTSAPGL